MTQGFSGLARRERGAYPPGPVTKLELLSAGLENLVL
jgi:hypothetical protein